MYRTHLCADIAKEHIGQEVRVCGWCNSYRDHGGIVFLDLRDKSGIVQLVCDPSSQAYDIASSVRDEFVLIAKGKVRARGEGLENPKLKTGFVEIVLDELIIENKSLTPPIDIGSENVGEDLRLKYRYLDLRAKKAYEIFKIRSDVAIAVRNSLQKMDFLEVETPILTASTPEGARDYLVPSRVHDGQFFALPQSPQIFKQLLMVGGFDRYFQIAKCFRDEDLRADRQPEFTQIDVEMSFCDQEDVMQVAQNLLVDIFRACGKEITTPFRRMTWQDAMETYGSDKPDLRFAMPLVEVSDLFVTCSNEVFASIAKDSKANRFKALCVKGGDTFFTRKTLGEAEEFVRKFGAKGLAYLQVKEGEIKGPLAKFLSASDLEALLQRVGAEVGDVVFFGAGAKKIVWDYMGRLRLKVAQDMGLIDSQKLEFLWVVDFPMFEINDDGSVSALHHPFTMPKNLEQGIESSDIESIQSIAYDSRLKSDVFAKEAAGVLAGNGINVRIYDALMPVPALSFATRYYECNAGIMITASHNPSKYNGFKAYGPDGCQMTDDAAAIVYDEIQKTDILTGITKMSFAAG
ncbi:MAG: aspartate--tRNA ligase, partial [Helicobacter sp.]|nr:aspartate--tRNA ligase [Helicobacter sp.]